MSILSFKKELLWILIILLVAFFPLGIISTKLFVHKDNIKISTEERECIDSTISILFDFHRGYIVKTPVEKREGDYLYAGVYSWYLNKLGTLKTGCKITGRSWILPAE